VSVSTLALMLRTFRKLNNLIESVEEIFPNEDFMNYIMLMYLVNTIAWQVATILQICATNLDHIASLSDTTSIAYSIAYLTDLGLCILFSNMAIRFSTPIENSEADSKHVPLITFIDDLATLRKFMIHREE
jgi:hypothetical protein